MLEQAIEQLFNMSFKDHSCESLRVKTLNDLRQIRFDMEYKTLTIGEQDSLLEKAKDVYRDYTVSISALRDDI